MQMVSVVCKIPGGSSYTHFVGESLEQVTRAAESFLANQKRDFPKFTWELEYDAGEVFFVP